LPIGAVCAAAAIAYVPSFAVPFQFDDQARLAYNQALVDGRLLDALQFAGTARVVPGFTLVLNYWLGGFEPLGYHVVNFAVHLLTSLGVFALALALCRTPRLRDAWPPGRARLLATTAGLLFACHPLQTQAVTYIIQRYASMVALFYVWAVVCYVRARIRQAGLAPGRPAGYLVAAAVLAVCAVLSKENAVSLPAALLLAEWVGFGWPRRWRMIVLGAAGALVIASLPVVWKTAFSHPAAMDGSGPGLKDRVEDAILPPPYEPIAHRTPALDYLRTQATVLPRYLSLVVLPWGQNIDHDVPIAESLSAPVLASAALLIALAALGFSQVRRRPLAAFAILWFFVTLGPESSVFALNDVMVEHRMYLPMAGLVLGIGSLFAAAVDRAPRAALGAGAVVAAGLVALTFARNLIWLSPITLWLDAAEKSPRKSRPHVNAGMGYVDLERLDDAVAEFCQALKLDPDDRDALGNLDFAVDKQGKLDSGDAEIVDQAPDGTLTLEIDDSTAYCP
jgi:hypothetical protein